MQYPTPGLRFLFANKVGPIALTFLAFLTVFAFTSTAQTTLYNSIPGTLAPNYASQGYQCCQVSEMGDYIHLTTSGSTLGTVTVTMSDWAKHSDYPSMGSGPWSHPITLNIYNVVAGSPNTVGLLIATITQNKYIPWRPEPTPGCGTGWQAGDGQCYSGLAFNLVFDMSSLNVTLPKDVIVGIAYNTNTWGAHPIGVGGPYDSLNVAVPAGNTATVGTDDSSDKTFFNSATSSQYCDHGTPGAFREDSGCGQYGTLPIKITTAASTTLTVTQANTQGFETQTGTEGSSNTSSIQYVNGPGTPPLGGGSLRMSVGSDGGSYYIYRNHVIDGTPLTDITSLSYSTYVTNNTGSQAVALTLMVDTDNDGIADDKLWFEPTYQTSGFFPTNPQGPLALGTWQTWDALNGGWYSANGFAGTGTGGPPVKPLSEIIAALPAGSKIAPSDGWGGLRLYVGDGPGSWDNFNGNVDNLSVGVNGFNTKYDFEVAPTIIQIRPDNVVGSGWSKILAGSATADFIVDSSAPLGMGALRQTTNNTDASKSQFVNTLPTANRIPVSSVYNLSYSTLQVSGPAVADSGYQITVWLNGNSGTSTTFSYEPYWNGTITNGVWQSWDVSSSSAKLWSSQTRNVSSTCQTTKGSGGPPFYSIPWIKANCPNAVIISYGLNIGTYNRNYNVEADNFRVNDTIYDFDPQPTVTIDQAAGQADPTNTSPIHFTATFSEAVSGFDYQDVLLTGSGASGANVAVADTGDHIHYDVTVTTSSNGPVIATIRPNAALSIANNAPTVASTSTDNTVYFIGTCNNITASTGIQTLRHQAVTVPVMIDSTTDRNILGYKTTITYDPSVLTFTGLSAVGTLSDGMTVVVNDSPVGTIRVFTFNTAPLAGAGVLFNLNFTADGAIGTSSPIAFSGTLLDEGMPCSTTSNGLVKIVSSTIDGVVTYATAPSTRPVPGATISAAGSVAASTTTATDGSYSLSGLGSGAYDVTPSKAAESISSTAITPFDSSLIARAGVGLATINSYQEIAADVTGDGTVSPLDAAYISQWKVGIPNPGITGTWVFIAPSTHYTDVETAHTDNYLAILKGDVTGNWGAGADSVAIPTESVIQVSLPKASAAAGSIATIPVMIGDVTDKGVLAYQFDVYYNPKVLSARNDADAAQTLSQGMSVFTNEIEPGHLKVAVYGINQMTGQGTLINLRFDTVGSAGMTSELKLDGLMLNENPLMARPSDGLFKVAESADNSIKGRVLSAAGQPINQAVLTLRGSDGSVYSVRSNAFGYFEVGGLAIGSTYQVTIEAKRYTFNPMTVSVGGSAAEIDVIANQ